MVTREEFHVDRGGFLQTGAVICLTVDPIIHQVGSNHRTQSAPRNALPQSARPAQHCAQEPVIRVDELSPGASAGEEAATCKSPWSASITVSAPAGAAAGATASAAAAPQQAAQRKRSATITVED